MPLPTTIRSQVDPAAITKVTRLFNNSLDDVLGELIQNARRAGASAVDLGTVEDAGTRWLVVRDDGAGIDDPSVILALGQSGWGQDIARREDPAGMGIFSLAGRHVAIASRSRVTGAAWRVVVPADAWESGAAIDVDPSDCRFGTEIRVVLDDAWAANLEQAARAAARYCPIAVRLGGVELLREDFLKGAERIVEDDGLRIGLFRGRGLTGNATHVNFHGVLVTGGLPEVAEKDRSWWSRVDIVDAPALQLVLPARKEMVQNAALDALRDRVRRAIYEHIASLGDHRLAFSKWQEAQRLGVELPEAQPVLNAWAPATADDRCGRSSDGPVDALPDSLLVEWFGAPLEQCADRALLQAKDLARRLVEPDAAMSGYSWYDMLSSVTGMRFELERAGKTYAIDGGEMPGLATGRVDRLDLVAEVTGSYCERHVIPAQVALAYDDDYPSSPDEALIYVADDASVSPEALTDLLEGACFSACSDRDCDSWDTQHEEFLLDARQVAARVLLGEDAALIERLRSVLERHARWMAPEDRSFHIELNREGIDIRIEPIAMASAQARRTPCA